jgi:hypothetical protein
MTREVRLRVPGKDHLVHAGGGEWIRYWNDEHSLAAYRDDLGTMMVCSRCKKWMHTFSYEGHVCEYTGRG